MLLRIRGFGNIGGYTGGYTRLVDVRDDTIIFVAVMVMVAVAVAVTVVATATMTVAAAAEMTVSSQTARERRGR